MLICGGLRGKGVGARGSSAMDRGREEFFSEFLSSAFLVTSICQYVRQKSNIKQVFFTFPLYNVKQQ